MDSAMGGDNTVAKNGLIFMGRLHINSLSRLIKIIDSKSFLALETVLERSRGLYYLWRVYFQGRLIIVTKNLVKGRLWQQSNYSPNWD